MIGPEREQCERDPEQSFAEAGFGLALAVHDLIETLKSTPEGRRMLRTIRWLNRHPCVARAASWYARVIGIRD